MRRTGAIAMVVVLGSAVIGLPPAGTSAQATPTTNTIIYVHDELGRMTAVIDPSQGVARYAYDAVGNITAITRPSLDTVSIIEVTPDRAMPGDLVRIQGTGFDADPASNAVTIGGVAATVMTASALELTVTVPDGAADAPVTVTSSAGTAHADEVLRIGSLAPVITGVSLTIVAPDDAITITGANLGPEPLDVDLVLNHTRGEGESTDGTVITTHVPLDTGSGPVSVATIDGEAIGPDLFVVPKPWLPGPPEVHSRS